jgi:23S rRNA (adenine2503-C2)-methyltransferase
MTVREMAEQKQNIKQLDLKQLEAHFKSLGEPSYRARQVYDWLWKKQVEDFDRMTNLSKSLREKLKENFIIPKSRFSETKQSADGTLKNAVLLPDELIVESVLIPDRKRVTACISSQVGCSLDCRFCATATLKRMRNLSVEEIVDQVVEAQKQSLEFYGVPLTNVVFMGMGEPLLNYDNVVEAIRKITSPEGLHFGAKRITVSTAGIPKNIMKLADDNLRVKLAVSLHSAIDETRSRLMPVNEKTGGLEALMDALQYWYKKTKSKITFEYLIFKDVNDDERHIRALVKYAKQVPSKVNLIEYNPTDSFDKYQKASSGIIERYRDELKTAGIVATVRRSRGQDIDAACGQLAAKYEGANFMSIPVKKIKYR